MTTTAKLNDTYCIGLTINGVVGEVTITKENSKSFYFEGDCKLLNTDRTSHRSGKATFWKNSADGKLAYYKCGTAVLTREIN